MNCFESTSSFCLQPIETDSSMRNNQTTPLAWRDSKKKRTFVLKPWVTLCI